MLTQVSTAWCVPLEEPPFQITFLDQRVCYGQRSHSVLPDFLYTTKLILELKNLKVNEQLLLTAIIKTYIKS